MNVSQKQLQILKQYSMSNTDVNEVLYNGPTVFIPYVQLYEMDSLLNGLDTFGRMMLLIPTESNTDGHWVCMFYNKDINEFHYWDPYGLKPDYFQGNWVKLTKLRTFGVHSKRLTELLNELKQQGIKVVVNSYDYQSYAHHPATCGRWSSLRLMLRNYTERKFKNLIISTGLPKDDTVTLIIYSIIGK